MCSMECIWQELDEKSGWNFVPDMIDIESSEEDLAASSSVSLDSDSLGSGNDRHQSCKSASKQASSSDRGRNERHKLSERQRRENTRSLVQDLQSILPNSSKRDRPKNINQVLQDTLEYIQAQDRWNNEGASKSKSPSANDRASPIPLSLANPLKETSRQHHIFAFDNAPMGMVLSGVDGNLLKANKSFQNWFGYNNGVAGGTIFSFSSPQDLSKVMQVCGLTPPAHALLLVLQVQLKDMIAGSVRAAQQRHPGGRPHEAVHSR
jgi:hypothetical protein